MAYFQIFLISVLGLAAIFLAVFVIKSVRSPKKISTIKSLLKHGKTANAIKIAKALISKDNRDIAAHYYLGLGYLNDHKEELAIMEFKFVNQEAIFDIMNIPEKEFRTHCGKLYKKFNQVDEALNEYILLSKLDPNNAEVFFETAKLFEEKKKYEHALGYYNKTIQLNKRHVKAHAARGMILFRAKQYAEAKKAIEFALQLNPDTFSTYYYLGKILKESKDYPGAVAAFEKATRDSELRQKALIERGTCFIASNNIEKAKNEFERAISSTKNENTNDTLYARYFLAQCFEQQRKIDLAITQWKLILQKNKNFRDVANKIAEYKAFSDNDAIKEYLTCADMDFVELCKSITTKCLGLRPQTAQPKKFGCEVIATEEKDSNWMDVRKKLVFLVFYRETDVIEEGILRTLLDVSKKQNYVKIFVITSSDFTRSSMSFAENRPLELINSDKLQDYLNNVAR